MVERAARAHIEKLEHEGVSVIVTCAYRSPEEQARLYARGRQAPGRIVTFAPPGKSFHQWRVAYDVAPVVDGKIPWDDWDIWNLIGELGEAAGLEWGGRWKKFREGPHFQLTAGLSVDRISNMPSDTLASWLWEWLTSKEFHRTLLRPGYAHKKEQHMIRRFGI